MTAFVAFAAENSTLSNAGLAVVLSGRHPNSLLGFRGRLGFDVGVETTSACRGTDHLVKTAVTLIVANDDNYALAA